MKATKRNTIILLSALAVTGVTIYIIVNRAKKKKEIKLINDVLDGKSADPSSGAGEKIISSQELNSLPTGVFPLAFGSKSKKVYEIQKLLRANHGVNIDLDGKYGQSTWEAMCSKIWNANWYNNKAMDCYDTNLKGINKKPISQSDFEAIKSKRS